MVMAQEGQATTGQAVQYPLTLGFKVLAFGPQISIRNASGTEVMYVHQKALKLKEDIHVYTDSKKTQTLFNIKADKIIDFSAKYTFTNANGMVVGSVKREGMRSIWKASYNVMDENGNVVGHIKEDNPWIKVADAVLNELPVVGLFTGYLFNPTYTLYRGSDESTPVLHLKKQPAFLEGKFTLEQHNPPQNTAEETRSLLAVLMMVLLERMRG